MITKDMKIIIVSKDNNIWQFPGGHPEKGESHEDTLVREVYEETGLNIKEKVDKIRKIGYYFIEEGSKDKYIQERYFILLDESSEILSLSPKEKEGDFSAINYVKMVELGELNISVPWITEVEDWNHIVSYLSKLKS
jgi:8-oxo-dGTP diphosphatase